MESVTSTKRLTTAHLRRPRLPSGMMRAVVFDAYGGTESAQVRTMQKPKPGPGEALVKVHAASVNPVDWKILGGMYGPGKEEAFPRILGLECAGIVEATQSPASYLAKGAHVICHSDPEKLGAFAGYIALPQEKLYPKPETVSFEAASCVPIAAATALQALRYQGGISAGKKVLILGAAGGVGHFAVQIASIFNAEVTAVCSSFGVELVGRLGAARILDRTKVDFTKENTRYDIIFDTVAKSSFQACEAILNEDGIYISSLPIETPPLDNSRKKAATVHNNPTAADITWITTEMESGRLTAIIDKTFPVELVNEALAYSKNEKAHGKIVLTGF